MVSREKGIKSFVFVKRIVVGPSSWLVWDVLVFLSRVNLGPWFLSQKGIALTLCGLGT